MHTGDPWKLHPDNWVNDESRGPIVHHTTNDRTLPGVNRPAASPHFEGMVPETDDEFPEYYRDKVGNRYHRDDFSGSHAMDKNAAKYGSANGLHFGTQTAAIQRSTEAGTSSDAVREWVHTARIPSDALKVSGGTRVPHFDDDGANFGPVAERYVNQGKAVPYTNYSEDDGSTSYRVKPEVVRTWGEDVMESRSAHPALRHVAERGYNPAVNIHQTNEATLARNWGMSSQGEQGTLWNYETYPADGNQPTGFHQEHNDAMAAAKGDDGKQRELVKAAGYANRNLSSQQMSTVGSKLPEQPVLHKTGRREGR